VNSEKEWKFRVPVDVSWTELDLILVSDAWPMYLFLAYKIVIELLSPTLLLTRLLGFCCFNSSWWRNPRRRLHFDGGSHVLGRLIGRHFEIVLLFCSGQMLFCPAKQMLMIRHQVCPRICEDLSSFERKVKIPGKSRAMPGWKDWQDSATPSVDDQNICRRSVWASNIHN